MRFLMATLCIVSCYGDQLQYRVSLPITLAIGRYLSLHRGMVPTVRVVLLWNKAEHLSFLLVFPLSLLHYNNYIDDLTLSLGVPTVRVVLLWNKAEHLSFLLLFPLSLLQYLSYLSSAKPLYLSLIQGGNKSHCLSHFL
jgi:hypothetical protein